MNDVDSVIRVDQTVLILFLGNKFFIESDCKRGRGETERHSGASVPDSGNRYPRQRRLPSTEPPYVSGAVAFVLVLGPRMFRSLVDVCGLDLVLILNVGASYHGKPVLA